MQIPAVAYTHIRTVSAVGTSMKLRIILYTSITMLASLLVSGCAVPMIGMSDQSCANINSSMGGIPLCHQGRTVSQYMDDAISVQRCGSWAMARDGSRSAPWDPECRQPHTPELQRVAHSGIPHVILRSVGKLTVRARSSGTGSLGAGSIPTRVTRPPAGIISSGWPRVNSSAMA